MRSSDLYRRANSRSCATVSATLGVRSGRLKVETEDLYLANGDDSGSLDYGYNTPVLALQWMPSPALNLYVSAGKGFESPTLNELAYRPDGGTGFNTALQPQTSLQLELGAKWRDDALGLAVEAALFRATPTTRSACSPTPAAARPSRTWAARGAAAPNWACAGSPARPGAPWPP